MKRLQNIVIIAILSFCIVYTVHGKKKGRNPARSLKSRKYAVQVSAIVQIKPPVITLKWPVEPCNAYVIYRRFLGEKEWIATPIASLDGKATGYVDKKVKSGVIYEYRIDRLGKGFIGRGYICSGINIPLTENRGKVILLVDKTFADNLKYELQRLELDLVGDGWLVTRHNVARDTSVTEVKKLIVDDYREDPENVKAVFIIGHVAVPYSGNIAPDGHKNHRGAWPADLFYGDMDGKWADEKEHKFYPHKKQQNLPGDGKYDLGSIPANSIELEVGRVDLSDMSFFPLNETELLRQYLNKDHFYRHGLIHAEARALIDDNFGSFRGEAFGSSAWRNFATFFGAENVSAGDWFTSLPGNSYLWAYGCGGGSHDRAGGVGNTRDFVTKPSKAVFTLLFGSYFGDWDRPNNFLRAPLASSGYSLTCAWDGRPHWYFHHMAMGKNIGYSTLRTQNSHPFQDYLACNDAKSSISGKDEDSEWDYNPVHVALMGDPTLRMFPVKPPRDVRISIADNKTKLTWKPAEEKNVLGYHIYVGDSLQGPFKRLTEKPVGVGVSTGQSTSVSAPTPEYILGNDQSDKVHMVKTLILQSSSSGTWFNTSQGVFVRIPDGRKSYQAPKVADQNIIIDEDTSLEVEPKLIGSTDKILLWSAAIRPDFGQVMMDKNGKCVYKPNPDYYGKDRFSMVAWDGMCDSNPAKIDIGIKAVPDAPRAKNRKLCLPYIEPIKFTLSAVDPDDKTQKLNYTITDPPKHGKLTGTPPEMTYIPGEETYRSDNFRFTADDGKLTSKPATVSMIMPYICGKSAEKKVIDGKFDDWKTLPIICYEPEEFRISGKKCWHGDKDCLFSIGIVYDDTYLYIAVKVIDDEYNSIKGKAPWEQDGIEVRIDARPAKLRSANRGKGEMKDFLLFAFSPGDDISDCRLYKTKIKLPEGVKYACVRSKEGFNTEIAIPLSYLDSKAGNKWDGFRFNVCIDDLDKDGLVQIWWKPDWRRNNDYRGSGSFIQQD